MSEWGILAGTTRFDLGWSGRSWVLRRAAAGVRVTKGCWKGWTGRGRELSWSRQVMVGNPKPTEL